MISQPKVSVIIPCYNHGEFIEDTLQSVLNQTFQEWECIIVNDGSTDMKTIKLLNENNWEKTKVINIKNSGLSIARNVAIANAKGKYILPLDADDLLASTFLKKAVSILDSERDISLVTCNVQFFGKRTGHFNLPEYSLEALLGQNLMVCTSMFRKKDFDLTIGYNPNMKGGLEDWDFWLSLLGRGGKVHKIDETLFYYRIRKSSMSTKISLEKRANLRKQIWSNHQTLYSNLFLDPTLTFEYKNVRYSREYKLGEFLLKPIRKLMRILSF